MELDRMLLGVLESLKSTSVDIEAAAVLSVDGLTMASILPSDLNEDHVGAMGAAMLSLGERTAQELQRGSLEQVLIKGQKGYVIMTSAGEETVLAVLAKSSAKLGLIFFDIKRAAKELVKILD
jgi:predicted regulator of Ras-like GTPase activity (Roadblock/LC7/MglB family)